MPNKPRFNMENPPKNSIHSYSSSPKEDFNPLDEDLSQHRQGPATDLYDELKSHYTEAADKEDDEPENDQYQYGVTPPNPRAFRRHKERSRNHKEKFTKKETLEVKSSGNQKFRIRSPHQPSHKSKKESERTLLEVKSPSGDEMTSPSTIPQRKVLKARHTERIQDRNYKRKNNMSLSSSIPKEDRCPYMRGSPVVLSPGLGSLQRVLTLQHNQSGVVLPVDCQEERIKFYSTFSMLIRMGNKASRDRERVSYVRQHSAEQEVTRRDIQDVLWMELQAILSNKKVEQQKAFLQKARKQALSIIEHVKQFRVRLSKSDEVEKGVEANVSSDDTFTNSRKSSSSNPRMNGSEDILNSDSIGGSLLLPQTPSTQESSISRLESVFENEETCFEKDVLKSEESYFVFSGVVSPADSPISSLPQAFPSAQTLEEAIVAQNEALSQVAVVIKMLDHLHSLYPSCAKLGEDYPEYLEEDFQDRLKTLYMWVNITRDMGHKMQQMANILHVERLCGVKWPSLLTEDIDRLLCEKYDGHPNGLIPDINMVAADSEEGSDEDDEEDYGSEDEDENDEEFDDENNEKSTTDSGVSTREPGSASMSRSKNVRFEVYGDSSPSTVPTTPDGELPEPHFPDVNSENMSTPARPTPNRSISAVSTVSHTSSSISFDEFARSDIYRHYVDRTLKRMKMENLRKRLRCLLDSTLQRAREALERPRVAPTYASIASNEKQEMLSCSPSMESITPVMSRVSSSISLSGPNPPLSDLAAHGVWSPHFKDMGLPSFKLSYLFLVRIPLDVIHECLRLRLEQMPRTDPSSWSVKYLIKECKEVLVAAVTVKHYYIQMVQVAMTDNERLQGANDFDMEQFEEDMRKTLDVYFEYLGTYMAGLQTQNLPSMAKHLKNFLEEEWQFAKDVCPHIRGGETNAGTKFCNMASSLFQSIADFLESGIDDCIVQVYDVSNTTGPDSLGDSWDFERSDPYDPESPIDSPSRISLLSKRNSRSMELKQSFIQTCRHFKALFNEARDRVAKTLNFAKMLRKDLEIAAAYNIPVQFEELLEKLKESSHVRVVTAHNSGCLIFVPSHMASDHERIMQLLTMTCGREDLVQEKGPVGYLLIVKYDGVRDNLQTASTWNGKTVKVESTAESSITLSHIQVDGMLLVVLHSSQLLEQRAHFERIMGTIIQLTSEQISCHRAICDSVTDLKVAALALQSQVSTAIRQVEDNLKLEDFSDQDEPDHASQALCKETYRETLLRCLNFGCEYHDDLLRLVSGEMRDDLLPKLVELSHRWMKFAVTKCERGRGRRPRWAYIGLNFLTVAFNPQTLAHMSDEKFKETRKTINECITHVIGDRKHEMQTPAYRVASPVATHRNLLRNVSMPDMPQSPPIIHMPRSAQSDPSTPFTIHTDETNPMRKSLSLMDGVSSDLHSDIPYERQNATTAANSMERRLSGQMSCDSSVQDLLFRYPRLQEMRINTHNMEVQRSQRLMKDKVIGCCTQQTTEVEYQSLIGARHVKFRWHRTTKIGEGQFGKVYVAVNNSTGELMAMKEISYQPNDIQQIKKIVDEIKNFEGIKHESLVQYYGVEVHRDEVYIFMEYVPAGTLADAAKQGLPEDMTRKYTRELLVAVAVLHEHNIVHRDVKGANIFLTIDGPLKLGDFGHAVKLKSYATMPGELGMVAGTPAFMAPEVFTQHDSGRASDIWGLGCVVIEMVTGKRPWPELDNHYQIMFAVGMGKTPAIPDSLHQEGKDFLSFCLQHDPKQRWTASCLQDHPFTKVLHGEDG